MDESVDIRLTKAEAIVLFELLASSDDSFQPDKVEQQALDNLEAVLEKAIPEVLGKNYKEKLKDARKRLLE